MCVTMFTQKEILQCAAEAMKKKDTKRYEELIKIYIKMLAN